LKTTYSETWQRTCLKWLKKSHQAISAEDLGGLLKTPQFAIDRAQNRLGQWDPQSRTISLSAKHLMTDIWLEVELTLRHEMAHQYVTEVLQAKGAQPHGKLFKRACALLGLGTSPRNEQAMEPGVQRVYDRVQKLMELSASSNQNEAEVAVAAAGRLLLKHNLKLTDRPEDNTFTYRWIGRATGRVSLEQKILSGILQEHFFVCGIWVETLKLQKERPLRVLEIMGRSENLELAEYTHHFLVRTLDTLWDAYRKDLPPEQRGRAIRNAYRVGVLMGFRERLENQQIEHTEQGLVWLGDPAINEFVRSRYPRTQSMRGGRYRVGDAHDAGRREGSRLRIRPGVRSRKESSKRLGKDRKRLIFQV
jgi:predicted SprT family Zn-dependent metalloprotease